MQECGTEEPGGASGAKYQLLVNVDKAWWMRRDRCASQTFLWVLKARIQLLIGRGSNCVTRRSKDDILAAILHPRISRVLLATNTSRPPKSGPHLREMRKNGPSRDLSTNDCTRLPHFLVPHSVIESLKELAVCFLGFAEIGLDLSWCGGLRNPM
jgi:hypothetical protein